MPDCKGRHHPLLHGAPRMFAVRPADPPKGDNELGYVGSTRQSTGTSVALQILPVTIRGPHGQRVQVNALLDLGSQVSLITEKLATDLALQGPTENLCLSTVAGSSTYPSKRVDLTVQPIHGDSAYPIRGVRTVPTISMVGSALNWPKIKEAWGHMKNITIAPVTAEPAVGLLIGADAIALVMPLSVRQGPAGAPWALRTRLGWVATGRLPDSVLCSQTRHVNYVGTSGDSAIYEQVALWWNTEPFGTKYQESQHRTKQEEAALQILDATTHRAGGHYLTTLLWASPSARLSGSYNSALSRLQSAERRLVQVTRSDHVT